MPRAPRPFRARILRAALLLSCTALAAADPPKPKPLPTPHQIASAHARFEPFSERVPLSTEPLEMIPIQGGRFLMAPTEDGAQPKQIEIKPFYISRTEVTWDHFSIFCYSLDLNEQEKAEDDKWNNIDKAKRSRPSKPYGNPDFNFGQQGYAAMAMTHKSATRFCQWLSQKTGRKYRLPTEAEWEYAARAGGPHAVPEADLDPIAWYHDNSEDRAHPVAEKKPNAWGLHDTLGNVAEWCVTADGMPIARGGSWKTRAKPAKRDKAKLPLDFAYRQEQDESWNVDPQDPKSTWWLSGGNFIGFRLVCDP